MNKLLYKHVLVILLVFISVGISLAGSIEEFNPLELNKIFNDLTTSDGKVMRILTLGKPLSLSASLEGTTKGNGVMVVHNINLRLFDQHDDGIVYEDALTVDIKDVSGDGMNELLIAGVLKFTGEKESDPVEYKPIVIIYTFDCEKGYFRKIYGLNSNYAELPIKEVKPIRCGKR